MGIEGKCFCGAVTVACEGAPVCQLVCHCSDCREWTGSIMYATMFKADQIKVTGELVSFQKKNPDGTDTTSLRRCCATCRGSVMNSKPAMGMEGVCAGVICGQGPTQMKFAPQFHLFYGERIKDVKDGLPKYKDAPKDFGGSDETLPEEAAGQ